MIKKPLILVTRATGLAGREALAQWVDAHQPVRALVRDPAKAKRLDEVVEVIVDDLVKPDTLTQPFGHSEGSCHRWPDFSALEANA